MACPGSVTNRAGSVPGHVICKRLWWAWACAACSVVAHGQLLASSDFLFGNDGWRVTSEDVLEVQLETRSSALYGRDTGDSVWYFEAPDAYLGEKSTAYAGSLSFRRSHSQYVDRSTPVLDDWDVTISSETYGLRLGASLSKLRGLEYALPLTNEHDPVWMNIDAGHIASKFEIVRVLHDLTSVRIRGGIYGGAEEVWLAMVKLIQGDDSPQHAQLVRRYVNDALGRDRDDSADVPDEEDAPLDMPTASLLDVSTAPGDEAIKTTPLGPQLQPGAVGPDIKRSTPGALTNQSTQVSATNRRARGSIIGEASMRQPSLIPHRELVESEGYVRAHLAVPSQRTNASGPSQIWTAYPSSGHATNNITKCFIVFQPILRANSLRICRIGRPRARHQEASQSRCAGFALTDPHFTSDSHAGWVDRPCR